MEDLKGQIGFYSITSHDGLVVAAWVFLAVEINCEVLPGLGQEEIND